MRWQVKLQFLSLSLFVIKSVGNDLTKLNVGRHLLEQLSRLKLLELVQQLWRWRFTSIEFKISEFRVRKSSKLKVEGSVRFEAFQHLEWTAPVGFTQIIACLQSFHFGKLPGAL